MHQEDTIVEFWESRHNRDKRIKRLFDAFQYKYLTREQMQHLQNVLDHLLEAERKSQPSKEEMRRLEDQLALLPPRWPEDTKEFNDVITDQNYEVDRPKIDSIYAYDNQQFFRRQCIYDICAERIPLTHNMLPYGPSFGTFSWDGSTLLWIDNPSQPQNIQKALFIENRPIDEADPKAMVWLLVKCLRPRQNEIYYVLDSANNLRMDYFLKRKYELDEDEWLRFSDLISPPTIVNKPDGSWKVDCWTLSGWMHDTAKVIHCRFDIGIDFTISSYFDEVCEKVFISTPGINY